MNDWISTNTFWTIWLFVHLILAVGLLGALTHQAMAVALPVRQPAGGIVTRFRAVPAAGYATAVCVLWVITYIVGSYIYTKYRIAIRIPLEAGHLLQDRRLLRFQGTRCDTRPRAAAGLLVFLEERAEPGIRQCSQRRDARVGRDVLVSLHRRPRSQQYQRVRIMSTTTGTASRTSPAASSLAASSKFKTFATVFSITGPVVYCVIQYFNYPLFTFHPATDRIVWGYEAARSGEGPNMLWYGWSATTILIAAALGIIAMLLPERDHQQNSAVAGVDIPGAVHPLRDLFADAVVDTRRPSNKASRWRFPGSVLRRRRRCCRDALDRAGASRLHHAGGCRI